ncbi:MAG TPA: carboxypeptidase-like regulatory domain-containing protein [Vicinamibacterales bacterium]|nr:carboxypeptidase-like regulatory domain-containing protein [Vicinamibacterales bacterium]
METRVMDGRIATVDPLQRLHSNHPVHRRPSARAMLIGVLIVCATLMADPAAAQERIPVGPASTVTLSRTDYDRLLDLASRRPDDPDVPPVPAALTRADLQVRAADGMARATMTVAGEVFRTGAVKVPLIAGATLTDARLDDRPLPLVADPGSGTRTAGSGMTVAGIIAGPAAFTATLEWAAPLELAPGRASFVLPVPPAGSATATIDLPGEQADIRIAPGLVLGRTSAQGRTLVEVTLDPGTPARVSWSTRDAPAARPRETRMLADVRTLVAIGDADLRLLALIDVTIVRGNPAGIDLQLPAGYQVTGSSGTSLERTEETPGRLRLVVTNAALPRHQFLISLERAAASGSFRLETGFPSVPLAQRETGEIGIVGVGTLAVSPAAEQPGMRRMDVREVAPVLVSAARRPLLAAYRYHRGPSGPPALALDVTRFPDAGVLAAIAERAVVTTLVTGEGRTLTEISLSIRNRAQPFAKVALPEGASVLSVEVAGAPARPVHGADGVRIPLLRAGHRPNGPYTVSFVYLHAGTPFEKKGNRQMSLPRMDLPITLVEWELFIPDRYRADRFDGDLIAADLVERYRIAQHVSGSGVSLAAGYGGGSGAAGGRPVPALVAGQIGGRVVDAMGAALPGVTITAEGSGQAQKVLSDVNGWYVIGGLPSGPVTITAHLQGLKTASRVVSFDQQPSQVDLSMAIGEIEEAIVVSSTPIARTETRDDVRRKQAAANEPSLNVQSLQRRAAGVLPIRIDVPRAGTSHRFIKPLVIDEEAIVSFRYRRR